MDVTDLPNPIDIDRACREHVLSLRETQEEVTALRELSEGLLETDSPWPPTLANYMHRYMHRHDLYQILKYKADIFSGLVTCLLDKGRLPRTERIRKKLSQKCKSVIAASAQSWKQDGLLHTAGPWLRKSPALKQAWESHRDSLSHIQELDISTDQSGQISSLQGTKRTLVDSSSGREKRACVGQRSDADSVTHPKSNSSSSGNGYWIAGMRVTDEPDPTDLPLEALGRGGSVHSGSSAAVDPQQPVTRGKDSEPAPGAPDTLLPPKEPDAPRNTVPSGNPQAPCDDANGGPRGSSQFLKDRTSLSWPKFSRLPRLPPRPRFPSQVIQSLRGTMPLPSSGSDSVPGAESHSSDSVLHEPRPKVRADTISVDSLERSTATALDAWRSGSRQLRYAGQVVIPTRDVPGLCLMDVDQLMYQDAAGFFDSFSRATGIPKILDLRFDLLNVSWEGPFFISRQDSAGFEILKLAILESFMRHTAKDPALAAFRVLVTAPRKKNTLPPPPKPAEACNLPDPQPVGTWAPPPERPAHSRAQRPGRGHASPGVVVRTEISGVVGPRYDGRILAPGVSNAYFFAWYAMAVHHDDSRGPPALEFHFQDALHARTTSIARGDEMHFDSMTRDIWPMFDQAIACTPQLPEFVILVREPRRT